MNLLLFGTTGGTGIQLLQQGLAAGHTITAFVRNPEAVTTRHERLRVIQGDVLNADSVAATMGGQEAVISAIGARNLDPTTIFSVGTTNMLNGMKADGVRRIMVISASALEVGASVPLWQKIVIRLVLQRLLRYAYEDARRMEAALHASATDWTIVRAPRLTDGKQTGRYQVAYDAPLSQAGISRADLAEYMLKDLNSPASYHKKVELAY
jgi:putative NADH-flavin reductase